MCLTLNLSSDKVVKKLCHSVVAALIIQYAMERGIPDNINLPFFCMQNLIFAMDYPAELDFCQQKSQP